MKKLKSWRESASIIIAARTEIHCTQPYDYNLLFLKRHKTANSFANFFVFPGGVIETADSDLKWHKFFKDHGYNESSFSSLFPSTEKRAEIFCCQENELPREMSLRICAIRETFEECGILLCKKYDDTTISNTADNLSISFDELDYWQNKVHSDANQFYNMCQTLQCLPNLWILHEWSNWITPNFSSSQTRFNAAFFFTCLSQIPTTKLECNEMEELLWCTPEYMKSLKISLMPPQQYEISRIQKYLSLDSLLHFATENSKNGVEQYLPIRVILLDGTAIILPGDSMYPENVSLQNQPPVQEASMTIQQFRDKSPNIHRMEFLDNSEVKLIRFSKL